MKSKLIKVLSLSTVILFSSCSNYIYDGKNMDDMSLIELNQYNSYLNNENESLKTQNESLLDISEYKNKEEIIDLINYVNNEVIKSNVMITNESKTLFHTSAVSSGSGTIIKEDSDYYYVLTNNHVIYSLGNRSSYYIYDYLNNEYEGTLLFSHPNYDMALLRFRKNVNLKVTKLANDDARSDTNIIAIGQPGGQRNAITFGEVLYYKTVECSNCNPNQSNISYECVYYDAITTNGNSGGMLINYDFELVGVVTFGMNNASNDYLYGAGSPVSKVREFLALNDFEVGDSNE